MDTRQGKQCLSGKLPARGAFVFSCRKGSRDWNNLKITCMHYVQFTMHNPQCTMHLHIRGEREFPFPVIPKNGGLWFPSRISGMDFFHSLSVPEFWEWFFFIPFPFPNFGNGFFPFPSRSRIDHFKAGNQKGKWEILGDACIPTLSASCTFHRR